MPFDKVKILPLEELIRIRERLMINKEQGEAARKLQNWWRNKLEKKHRKFKFSIFEIKLLIDKVIVI